MPTIEVRVRDEDWDHCEKDGRCCPFCGFEETEGSSVETGGGHATQEMSCLVCDGEWEDQYKLIGFNDYSY